MEDHCKGTLHYHLIFYGSISPYALQVLSEIPSMCKAIYEVLNNMYKANFSSKTYSRHLIHCILRKATNINLKTSDLQPYIHPAVLQQGDLLNDIKIQKINIYVYLA